jgi:hypothetical protein
MRRTSMIVAICIVLSGLVAQPASATWQQSTVSDMGNSDSQTSRIVIAPTGRTYVTWQTQGSDELYWAKKTSTGWRRTTVTGGNTYVACYDPENDWMGPSATFLPNGDAAIASACESFAGGSKTMFSRLTGKGWTTTKVGYGPSNSSCTTSATDIDLIVSPSGKPVIFTTDQCLRGIYGFFRTSTGWRGHWVLKGGGCCGAFRYGAMSLAVDPSNGKIAMAEIGDVYGRSGLEFQEFNWKGDPIVGSLHSFVLPNGDAPYGEPSLAFAADGTAYLAFQEGTQPGTDPSFAYSFLTLAERTGGVWGTPTAIDNAVQFTGGDLDLSLGGGSFHIAYSDDTNKDLRLATSPDGTTWTLSTIFANGNTGHFPSVAVASNGETCISFYHRTDTSLRAVFGP